MTEAKELKSEDVERNAEEEDYDSDATDPSMPALVLVTPREEEEVTMTLTPDLKFRYCGSFEAPSEELSIEQNALTNASELSMVQRHMELQQWRQAATLCGVILDRDALCIEARHRRALALSKLQEFQEALDDVFVGIALDPENQELQALQQELKAEVRKKKSRRESQASSSQAEVRKRMSRRQPKPLCFDLSESQDATPALYGGS
eukprot:gnl/MRDRNA2_/MRDRNA2_130041_c0_seq1.p1 gnl/MRDRNA2_/MRDRNA2_130041_c0~~gnl/MRDRNA2_/MRDRNA2_130041_c0_seq1.p1  ORF type:complete len:206 (-),score=54.80 gnl/MRDRNA2_/MRDRNA2_130041_c0_seq1:266-883(-)